MDIYYAVCGEGRGHAGRALPLISNLRRRGHRITVFSFGDGLELLRGENVPRLYPIHGFRFGAGTFRTVVNYCVSRGRWEENYRAFSLHGHGIAPDLCITDFEPSLPRFAKAVGCPVVSIDNQHRFLHPHSGLPWRLRAYCFAAGCFIRNFIPRPDLVITSTFHASPDAVPVMVRKEIAAQKPKKGSYILAYLKPVVQDKILSAVAETGLPCRVYGGKPRYYGDQMRFCKMGSPQFASDLAGCRVVVCTAGHQLIGEARFLGKRVLAIHLPGQSEQAVNAHYVNEEHIGVGVPYKRLDYTHLLSVLYEEMPRNKPENGVDGAVRRIEEFMAKGMAKTPSVPVA